MRGFFASLGFCSVAARAASLDLNGLSKRDTCSGGNYTSPDGLHFDIHCIERIDGLALSDSILNSTEIDIYACANRCSIGNVCSAAVFNRSSGNCELLRLPTPSGDAYTASIDINFDAAFVDPETQVTDGYDTACPYGNLTTVTIYNGMQATVYCGLDIIGSDYCPRGNVSCPNHATSLQQCLEYCSESHPLCWGVSYDPTLTTSYANCYLKGSKPNNDEFHTGNGNGAILHSALVSVKNGTSLPVECTENDEVTSKDGHTFVTNCDSNQDGNNLWQFHEDSLQSCIDSCASWKNGGKCVGVVYDAQVGDGWQNCYLKNATSPTTQVKNFTLALPSGGASTQANPASHGGSKAWIAGPVVGGFVALGLLAGAVVWLRTRRGRERHQQKGFEKAELPASSGSRRWQKAPQPSVQADTETTRLELEDTQQPVEMPD